MSEKWICAYCGKEHVPYAYEDRWEDRDYYMDYQEELSKYPHTFAGSEVHIYIPICRECYLAIFDETPEWDEEYLEKSKKDAPIGGGE